MKKYSAIAAIGAAMIALPASAQVMQPSEYVAAARSGDLYEITSSKIVLETTQNPQVSDFARMMVMNHTKSSADLTAAARRSRLRILAPRLNPLQQELISELRAESGAARDATYLAQQKAAHGQALALHKAYAMEGPVPALRTIATTVVPVVEDHIAALKTM